jgi:hypothetical protein
MPEQVHETCEPIRPEDLPTDLIEAVYPTVLANGIPWHVDAVRILAAALLTEACERIAQAVEVELAEEGPDDMLLITRQGERAAAVIRSWPEGLDD